MPENSKRTQIDVKTSGNLRFRHSGKRKSVLLCFLYFSSVSEKRAAALREYAQDKNLLFLTKSAFLVQFFLNTTAPQVGSSLFFLLILALLIGNPAASLASRLAGGLALAATALLGALT